MDNLKSILDKVKEQIEDAKSKKHNGKIEFVVTVNFAAGGVRDTKVMMSKYL